MILYCLNYNNYYNRIAKKEDSLTDYESYLLGEPITKINFNPADGINTTQVLNWREDEIPNYILVVDDTNTEIVSRWFILEMKRECNGQYTLYLRRDVIADNYNDIITAPCFIEKATLQNNDPMIFNKENMTFNQIKVQETPLKDESGCPWIVGYFARTDGESTTSLSGTATKHFPADITVAGIENWEYYRYTSEHFTTDITSAEMAWGTAIGTSLYKYKAGYNTSTGRESVSSYGYVNYEYVSSTQPSFDTITTALATPITDLKSYVDNELNLQSAEARNTFLNLDDKVIYDSLADKYYRINLAVNINSNVETILYNSTLGLEWDTALMSVPNTYRYGEASTVRFILTSNYEYYLVELVEDSTLQATYNIPTDRYHLTDAPYDMFAIPYADGVTVKNTGATGWTDFQTSKELAFNVAMSIAEKYAGASYLYDIQLLPYCPVRTVLKDGVIDLANDTAIYSTITQQGSVVGVILNASTSSFTLDIQLDAPITIEDAKVQSMCDMYRLCSPNYNGVFEFNAAQNGGISRFNVDCTYLPYNPYIHINPDFKLLYGQDFNDNRGLICGGDFSLPIVTDSWETYKLNNKNYELIFNRQIENMEVNNAVQREREIWSAASGTVSAAVSGATAGGLVGSLPGALVGGLVSGISSGLAGARDIQLNEQLRQEAIDYTKDQYTYNLGNIQALPDGLAKTTAYTANNKIFPFLEYYTCTETERNALINKMKYNGMTVMRIGTIQEFIQTEKTYIKGQLIRLEIAEDYHIVNEIANEINKGVFI